MIKNLSYNSKKINTVLLELVGRPFSFIERLKLGGIGSNKLVIADASKEIVELLRLDNNVNYCNIEIRKNGEEKIINPSSLATSNNLGCHSHGV